MSSFASDVIKVFKSKVIIIVVGVLNSMITARYIGPEGNGIIAGITVYPILFMAIGSLGIRQSTAYYVGKGLFDEEKIKTTVVQIWFLTTIFSVLVCFFLVRYFSNSGFNLIWVLLGLMPIPFSLYITYNSGIFLGKNDIKTFNSINWIPPFIVLLSTLLLVVFFKMGVTGAMISMIVGPLIMCILLIKKINLWKSLSLKLDLKIFKEMLSLGLIYALSLLVINLNYKVDVLLIDKYSTSYELGIYTKGATITEYLWQIPMLFSTVVFARSATSKNDLEFSYKVSQLLRISCILIGVVSIILFLFSKFIITTLYGDQFLPSYQVLNSLLPGVLLLTIYKVLNMDLAGKGKPWVSMIAMLPSLVVNVVLNIILIPKYGAVGSAISSTISYSLAACIFLFVYSNIVKIPVKEILTYKKSDFLIFTVYLNKVRNKLIK